MKHLQFPPLRSVESPRRVIYSYSSHVLLVCENCLLHVKTGRYCLLRMCVINRCQFFVHKNENTLNFVGTNFVPFVQSFPNCGSRITVVLEMRECKCCSWL